MTDKYISSCINKIVREKITEKSTFIEMFLASERFAKSEWKNLGVWKRLFTNWEKFRESKIKEWIEKNPPGRIEIRKPVRYTEQMER